MDETPLQGTANLLVGQKLDATFRALADPTRRAMLMRLANGERSVGELTRGLGMSATAGEKHVKALAAAQLVVRRKAGKHTICALAADPLGEAALWLREWGPHCSPAIDQLAGMLSVARRLR